MIEKPAVLLEIDGNIATITLNRPERRNAVNALLAKALNEAIEKCEDDSSVSVTILTGAGSSFCAGMDLVAFGNGEGKAILHGSGRFAGFVGVKRRKPVIAAVNGPAMAGGFEIMLACDLAVSVDTTVFGLPEARRGLIAGAGGVFRLARRLPIAVVNEMTLTGDPITAARALELGLVNRVVPSESLMKTARELAEKIAASAPLSVSLSLDLARTAASGNEEVLWHLNDKYLDQTIGSEDAQEGARAFLEKRSPIWRGV
ncbi:enoyl-CoA hydratase-related protein [Heliomarina baculiformis]|uniref:enoyl-CoA hydratase-related protein n=1 Tax=Heliomarina baculiformis TaxID=2872036 RepID=UPI001EE35AB6|nr:enoyl-CoA hydratase-related protein [Heliomarina baculiformis]